MEDTTASSVVRFFKNDNGKTNKTLGLVVSIHAISSGRPKRNIKNSSKHSNARINFQTEYYLAHGISATNFEFGNCDFCFKNGNLQITFFGKINSPTIFCSF